MLSKGDILQILEPKLVKVTTIDLPCEIYVKVMSLIERERFENLFLVKDEKQSSADYISILVALTACDASGNLLFSETDIETLKTKNSMALFAIFKEASRLNGLTAADIKELEKNSGQTQSDDSTSD